MHPERGGFIENKTGNPNRSHEESGSPLVSRREFLRQLGMGSVALGLGMCGGFMEEADTKESKANLETLLEERGGSGHPAVSIEFIYALHRTARDMQKLRERIAGADIVTLEGSGWEKDQLKAWRDLSEGTVTPAQVFQKFEMSAASEEDRKWLEEYNIIYNSHKAIDTIDVPYGHPLSRAIDDHLGTPIFFYDGDFEKALGSMRGYTKNWADIQKKRETYMLSRLKEVIKERALPDQKRELKIAIGGVHTGMWHTLKSEGADARAEFSSMPFIFNNQDELLRRYLFGKSVDNELVASALLENIFLNQFGWPPTEDTQKAMLFFRKLVSQFTVSEIKETFEKLRDRKFDERSKVWTERLRAKHIRWPRNEKEVDAFLDLKTPPR
jgi:hypothetical protein